MNKSSSLEKSLVESKENLNKIVAENETNITKISNLEEEINKKSSTTDPPSSSGMTSEDIKGIMQDIYAKSCEFFIAENEDGETITYESKDVLKRVRLTLKSVTNERSSIN
jgi:hypothetical protein